MVAHHMNVPYSGLLYLPSVLLIFPDVAPHKAFQKGILDAT